MRPRLVNIKYTRLAPRQHGFGRALVHEAPTKFQMFMPPPWQRYRMIFCGKAIVRHVLHMPLGYYTDNR
jgi:hypothetical protein